MAYQSDRFVIAVVDDDRSILRSLEYLLESADYAVRLYASGTELIDDDCLHEIDCLISDIDMPGMDGLELLQRVHAARPALPLIVITGYPDALSRTSLLDGSHPRCFIKPFDGPALLVAVGEALRKASDARASLRKPADNH